MLDKKSILANAPEDATHYSILQEEYYYQDNEGTWYYYSASDRDWAYGEPHSPAPLKVIKAMVDGAFEMAANFDSYAEYRATPRPFHFAQAQWDAARKALDLPLNTPEGSQVDATLAERGKRYGCFAGHARITQNLKVAMCSGTNWDRLTDSQKESLEMIAHKIGRILNGDPNYADSWHDIAGYAQLVEQQLNGD